MEWNSDEKREESVVTRTLQVEPKARRTITPARLLRKWDIVKRVEAEDSDLGKGEVGEYVGGL